MDLFLYDWILNILIERSVVPSVCFYGFFSFFFVNDTQSIKNKDDKRHTLYSGILAVIFTANILITNSGYIHDKYSAMTILINVAFAIALIVNTIIGKS